MWFAVLIIDALMTEIGDDALQFVPPEYARRAQRVFNNLHVGELTFQNIWNVFSKMLPHMK